MLFSSSSSSSSSEFAPPSSPAVMMVVSSLRSLARSRQRRFPARDDRAPPAENDKHQMFLFPIARIHRVFPRVRHFRRGVRVRRVRALLLGTIPRESEDDKASLRKAETPDITCIRYVRLFARSNNDPKKKGSRFSRWSIFSNRERSTLFASSSSSSENDADDETNNDTDDTDDSVEGRKKTSSFTSFGRETSCDDAFFSRRFAIR